MRYVNIESGWKHLRKSVANPSMTNAIYIGLSIVGVFVLFGLLTSCWIVQEFRVKVQKGNENLSCPKYVKLLKNGLASIRHLGFLISVSSIKGDQLLPVLDHRAELWWSSRIEGVFLQHLLLPKAAG